MEVPGEAAEGVVAAAGAEPEADGHEQAAHGGERPPAEAGLAARLRERLLPPADAERTCRSLSCPPSHIFFFFFALQTNSPSSAAGDVAGGADDDGHELRVSGHQRPPERGGGATAGGSAARREPCWVCHSFLATGLASPCSFCLCHAFAYLATCKQLVCAG